MTLEELRQKNGIAEAPEETRQFEAAAAAADKRKADRQTVEDLKTSIREQLKQGTEPQYILYSALKAIALLSGDPEFLAECTAQLDGVYSDLAQRSLWNDNAITAQKRLDTKTAAYGAKLKQQIERQISAARKIEKELADVLKEIPEVMPPAGTTPPAREQ